MISSDAAPKFLFGTGTKMSWEESKEYAERQGGRLCNLQEVQMYFQGNPALAPGEDQWAACINDEAHDLRDQGLKQAQELGETQGWKMDMPLTPISHIPLTPISIYPSLLSACTPHSYQHVPLTPISIYPSLLSAYTPHSYQHIPLTAISIYPSLLSVYTPRSYQQYIYPPHSYQLPLTLVSFAPMLAVSL